MGKDKLPDIYQEAKEWAQLFLKRLNALEKAHQNPDYNYNYYSPERAAVKRTSLDLAKALVKLRKPQ